MPVFQIFALSLQTILKKALKSHRDVAQLVAHYVRDVGVGRSSRLIPTNSKRLLGRKRCDRIGTPLFVSIRLIQMPSVVPRLDRELLSWGNQVVRPH